MKFLLVTSVFAVFAVANAAVVDKYANPWSISAACGQIGEGPENLADELAAIPVNGDGGFDFSCYAPGPYVDRWSTTGLPAELVTNLLAAEEEEKTDDAAAADAEYDMMGDGIEYITPVLMMTVPILVFGILAFISCACWSCGMMKCCAGGEGRSRKCCGKCCANPPKFTEGTCEWFLIGTILFLGVVVVGLAGKGLEANTIQNDAILKLGDSFGLLTSWTNATAASVDDVVADFNATVDASDSLIVVLSNMQTTEVQDASSAAAQALKEAMEEASAQVASVSVQMADMELTVSDMKTSFTSTLDTMNGYRDSGFKTVWALLMTLMIWSCFVALVRQAAPDCMDKIRCVLGTVTFFYLWIMLFLFIVLFLMSFITVLVGDFCQDPDTMFKIVSGDSSAGDVVSTIVGSTSTSTSTTTTITTIIGAEAAAAAVGTELLGYFITCDTDADTTNSFNSDALVVFEQMGNATGQINTIKTMFSDQEQVVADAVASTEAAVTVFEDNGDTSSADYNNAVAARDAAVVANTNFQADKTNVFAAVNDVNEKLGDLVVSVEGNTTYNNYTDGIVIIPAQGMYSGMFSMMECYQVNARYQAMTNLVCTQLFDSLAMTIEYLLVAGIFMVLVEFCKRWLRPYNLAYAKDNQVAPCEGEDKWALSKG